MIEIGGMIICIVGMGEIGRHVAQRTAGVMSRADVIMIAGTVTKETRGLINAEKLAVMKPTAFLSMSHGHRSLTSRPSLKSFNRKKCGSRFGYNGGRTPAG